MAITAISRDWGADPSIIRIVTSDDYATITAAGYLTDQAANIRNINNGDFEFRENDVVLASYGANNDRTLFDVSSDFTSLTPNIGAQKVLGGTSAAWAGGGASNAFAAAGILATDHVTVTISNQTNGVSIEDAVPSADTITVTFSGDPGADTVVRWVAVRD